MHRATTRPTHEVSQGDALFQFAWGKHCVAVTRVYEPGNRAVVAKCVVGENAANVKATAAALMKKASCEAPVAPASAAPAVSGRAETGAAMKAVPATPVAAPAPTLQPLTLDAVTSQPFVLKFALVANTNTKDIAKEKANLAIVAGIKHVVRAVDVSGTALDQDFLLVLEDAGTPLSSMCLCDDVRGTVLNLLETQIKPALAAIHQRSFIFFDLHAGNVVCDNPADPKNLCLIDLESLTKIGDPLSGSPLKRAHADELVPAAAQIQWDWGRFDALKQWVANGGREMK